MVYINPSALTLASDGNFYGVTSTSQNDGSVFKMTPSGAVTTLHTFSGTDGSDSRRSTGTGPERISL